MRPDMTKVIVERERSGRIRNYHFARNKKKFRPKDIDEAVTHESMTKRHVYYYNEHKSLNENLSPLKGFLRSRVGKPWNKVYSELNTFTNVNSAVQAHIRQHLKQYVELHAVKDEYGQYCAMGRFGKLYLDEGDLFVDEHSILRSAKLKPNKIKLLPGQKLYTIYRQATKPSEYTHTQWYFNLKYCLHSEYVKIPESPYIWRQMTFIACSRDDIAKAMQECNKYGTTVMWIRPEGSRGGRQ